MNMTHGTNGGRPDQQVPPRSSSEHSHSGSQSSASGSKHVKCIGRYVLTQHTLGKGNFARVEAAVHTLTRAKVAIKIIETDKIKEDYVRKNLLREAQLMRRLRHPNIIRLYETMKSNNLYCLVMEVAEGDELLSHVRNDSKEKKLSEAAARSFVRQLVSALHYLHSTGIVHRDLKMENILLDKKKKTIKLVDFGLSNSQRPGSLLQTHCGSPEYAAPELFIPGREYGPEVDVWSLGVNMYAMLLGKLPFRSPRHGTKRRQRLLEQIAAGLSETHEKEMAFLSPGAKDLLHRFLQPDPHKRVKLDAVMQHLWITNDGKQLMSPYKYTPPDAATQHRVIELMSQVLEVSQAEIKEAVRRDRCDWLAAIYNLLIDQPEGRNILQQMVACDPNDQLVDAAHYQGSTEHLRLSQADSFDQTPPDVVGSKTTTYRHSLMTSPVEPTSYASSTLPITSHERRRRHSAHHPAPLGAPPVLNPVQPPPYMRRASQPYTLPAPQQMALIQPAQDPLRSTRGRRLPMTPNEEPFQHTQDPVRPHSRAESAPDPLPIPWKSKLTQRIRSPAAMSPNASPPTSPRSPFGATDPISPTPYKEPLVSPLAHLASKVPRKKSKPAPVTNRGPRPRSMSVEHMSRTLSGSVDAQLHIKSKQPHALLQNWSHVAPRSRLKSDGVVPQLGWTGLSRHKPNGPHADIQALMEMNTPLSPYSSVQEIPHGVVCRFGPAADEGSTHSVELKHELFSHPHQNKLSPQASKAAMVKSAENLKVDPISGAEYHQHGPRSSPVKHTSMQPQSVSTLSSEHMGTHSTQLQSASHVSRSRDPQQLQARKSPIHVKPLTSDKVDLPNIMDPTHSLEEVPVLGTSTQRVKTGKGKSGFNIGKAFKFSKSRAKSLSATLHPKPTLTTTE